MNTKKLNKIEKEVYDFLTEYLEPVGYKLSCKECRKHIAIKVVEITAQKKGERNEEST